MPSLKEIKNRVDSVNSTLKITSAMKMVAAAKLHKAQTAIGNMLPYEDMLHRMLANLIAYKRRAEKKEDQDKLIPVEEGEEPEAVGLDKELELLCSPRPVSKVALVVYSSNSSLCGGFNSAAIKQAESVIDEYLKAGLTAEDITVYPVGKKIVEAMRKKGFDAPADYTHLSEHPNYEEAANLSAELVHGFMTGRFDKVELLYGHFKSTSSQPTMRDTYLPLTIMPIAENIDQAITSEDRGWNFDYIVEPDVDSLLEELLPKVMMLKMFTVQLDTNAAEHAARTVAMQTATDNGNEILQELTLEYNKNRQQKITSEILDIVGGSLQ